MRHMVLLLAVLSTISFSWAETTPAQSTTTTPATQPTTPPATPSQQPALTQPSLRQQGSSTTAPPANLATLQQKHKQEIEQQNKRLILLEEANQNALAKNQELQIKNDNLAVQIQVLQSERSAQMFLYGAVTFGAGTFMGIIIYSLLYTRRRRSW